MSCVGASSIYDESMNDALLRPRAFLPQYVDMEQTCYSSKYFTIHPWLVHRGDVIHRGHDSMTMAESKTHSQHHQTCVAFA